MKTPKTRILRSAFPHSPLGVESYFMVAGEPLNAYPAFTSGSIIDLTRFEVRHLTQLWRFPVITPPRGDTKAWNSYAFNLVKFQAFCWHCGIDHATSAEFLIQLKSYYRSLNN